jgi:hypothetical protein
MFSKQFSDVLLGSIRSLSSVVNKQLLNAIKLNEWHHNTNVVLMDFLNEDLVKNIIKLNFYNAQTD